MEAGILNAGFWILDPIHISPHFSKLGSQDSSHRVGHTIFDGYDCIGL